MEVLEVTKGNPRFVVLSVICFAALLSVSEVPGIDRHLE